MNPILTSTGQSPSKKRARPEDGDNNNEQSPAKIPRLEPPPNPHVIHNDRRAFKRFKKHAKLFARNDRIGKGFLASCKQGREPQTVSELLPLLHKSVNIIDPNAIAEHTAANTGEDPAEQKKKFFEVYETKTAGLVAIRFVHNNISATQLLDTLLTLVDVGPKTKSPSNNTNEDTSEAKTEEKSAETTTNSNNSDKYQFKFCCRITPVELFCPAQLEAILERLQPLISNVFTPNTPIKYAIVFNARNNNTLDKRVCIDKVGDLIGNTFHKVDLSNPEYVVLLEIFKDACGVSVVKNYYTSNRFSVNNKTAHLPAPKPQQNNKKNKGKKGNGKKKATGGQAAKKGNKSATDGEKKTRRRSTSTAAKNGKEKGGK